MNSISISAEINQGSQLKLKVFLRRINSETFNGKGNTSRMDITPNLRNTSSDNILAYRPNYRDGHDGNLATLFVNMEALYPCISHFKHVSCKLFPSEDDGFRGGRAIFEAGDNGGNFRIFGGHTVTYAFAIEGCTQLTASCVNNGRGDMRFILVCLLPSSRCSDTD